MGDHDGLFKLGFGDPLHAAGELRSVLPFAILDAVALDQLEAGAAQGIEVTGVLAGPDQGAHRAAGVAQQADDVMADEAGGAGDEDGVRGHASC